LGGVLPAYWDTAVFERLAPEPGAIDQESGYYESITFDLDLVMGAPAGGVTQAAAERTLASEDTPGSSRRAQPDLSGVKGKKRGERFPYGLWVASSVHEMGDPGAETAELTTTLMIGLGLISVGLFRRFYNTV
jgi:hypothetical protein